MITLLRVPGERTRKRVVDIQDTGITCAHIFTITDDPMGEVYIIIPQNVIIHPLLF